MKKYYIALIMSAVLVFPATVFSQYYLPVGLMPMEYNSSFAGSAGNSRICSNTLLRSNKVGVFHTNDYGFYTSYDKFLPKLRSGIGIKASGANSSNIRDGSNYNFKNRIFDISAIIAPKISIKGKYTVSPSLELGYNNVHWQSTYGDSIDNFYNGFTGMAGILFNASNFYVGYKARIYENEDNMSYGWFYNFYSIFQFGYSFQKSADSKFSFTPQIVFPLLSRSNSIEWCWPSFNLGFRYNNFLYGLVFQYPIEFYTGIQVGYQLGLQKNGWRFLLTNQFENISSPTVNFSLRHIINQDKRSIHILNTY